MQTAYEREQQRHAHRMKLQNLGLALSAIRAASMWATADEQEVYDAIAKDILQAMEV